MSALVMVTCAWPAATPAASAAAHVRVRRKAEIVFISEELLFCRTQTFIKFIADSCGDSGGSYRSFSIPLERIMTLV